jgi:hypothetical protein
VKKKDKKKKNRRKNNNDHKINKIKGELLAEHGCTMLDRQNTKEANGDT